MNEILAVARPRGTAATASPGESSLTLIKMGFVHPQCYRVCSALPQHKWKLEPNMINLELTIKLIK